MATIKLIIDGLEVTGSLGQTILEIARENDIIIPTMCHDDKVDPSASCGLCTVELEGRPALLRSCASIAAEGMVIHTNTERVRNNRRAALELLLSDHTGDCRAPCALACPAQTDCQGYVGLIANGAFDEAYALIKEKIPLPASIGRVCPHPCEDVCRRELIEEPISIMALKQFAADLQHARGNIYTADVGAPTGKSVAVIGGGPGGLTAAYFLRAKGHEVTVYDSMPLMGGMLRYGIPEYRLPKRILQEEIDAIEKMGVKLLNNTRVGQDVSLDDLRKEFDAVVIAIGAWTSTGMGCPGEDLDGVHGGIEFLWNVTGISPRLLRRRVAIVGGGNTAMDACRTSVRSGASVVYNIYRRTRNEMPAEETEIVEAEEEGVIFKNLTNPIEIVGEDGKVMAVRLQIMELGEPDASGRRSPVPVPGKEETIEVDIVIMAIGQKPVTLGFEDIEQTKWSTIIADEHTFRTNIEGVFAVGDATNNGADIAITAIGEAGRAAEMIHKYLCGEQLTYEAPYFVKSEKTGEDFIGVESQPRVKMPHRTPGERKIDFLEINHGFSEDEAGRESVRCLECGCMDFFECKLVGYAVEYEAEPDRFCGKVHHRTREDSHPFIRRDPDKCVLCGLCVRICEEVTGATALGFMERGFDTVVLPAFDAHLQDTDCISCGQCVHACPTGALTETLMLTKQTPVRETLTETACSFCSAGCKMVLASNGKALIRSLPSNDKGSLLCMKGRFGFGEIWKADRISLPYIRGERGMEEATFEEAVDCVNKSLRGLQENYGNDCVAVAISHRYTNEEAFLITEYAKKALKTSMVFSLGLTDGGLQDVLGNDASTATFDDLNDTELIVVVAPDSEMYRSVAAMRIRRAVRNGAKLLILSSRSEPEDILLDDIASERMYMDGLEFFEQIIKVLLDSGCGAGISGRDDLFASLASTNTISQEAQEAADMISGAGKAVFIFDRNILTAQSARLIANIAVLTGNAGGSESQGSGIIQILSGANSQGLINLGIGSGEDFIRIAAEGKIRGLFNFGEEVSGIDLRNIEFFAVQEGHMTEAARQSNVVLPGSSFAEKTGTFTSCVNVTGALKPAVPGLVAWDNFSLMKALAKSAGEPFKYKDIEEIRSVMLSSQKPKAKSIKLAAASKDSLLRSYKPATNALMNRLMRFAAKHGLK